MDASLNQSKARIAVAEASLDPVRFVQQVLKVPLWDTQQEILRSILGHRRTAVKACHSSGKTLLAALATLWWISRFPDGVVITTAPTWRQVKELLWREINNAILKADVAYPEPNKTQLSLGPKNFALGLSTDEPEKFQGFHSRHLLVIMDEAPGIREDIWQAIRSLMAGGFVRLLALGNPTVPSGPFFDAFNRARATWSTLSIGAWDCPTLRGLDVEALQKGECKHEQPASGECHECDRDPTSWEFLISADWVVEQLEDWGESHPYWIARVLGQFPSEAEGQLISLKDLENAKNRSCDHDHKEDFIEVGLDVAGEGADETVLVARRGQCILRTVWYKDADPRGKVAAELYSLGERLSIVRVDAVGIGYHFGTHLRDIGFPVEFFYGSGTPSRPARYMNLRAEVYEELAQMFRAQQICGLDDDKTLGQLASIKYELTAKGQIKIEAKSEAKKRGIKSPDRADALSMAFRKFNAQTLLTHLEGQLEPTLSAMTAISAVPDSLPVTLQGRFQPGEENNRDAKQMIQWYEEAVKKYTEEMTAWRPTGRFPRPQ